MYYKRRETCSGDLLLADSEDVHELDAAEVYFKG